MSRLERGNFECIGEVGPHTFQNHLAEPIYCIAASDLSARLSSKSAAFMNLRNIAKKNGCVVPLRHQHIPYLRNTFQQA